MYFLVGTVKFWTQIPKPASPKSTCCLGVWPTADSNCGFGCVFIIFPFPCLFTVEKAPVPSLFDQKAPVSSFDQQQQPVKVVYYRAVYPFDARSHDEISIAPGDVIMVCSMHTSLVPIHLYPSAVHLATYSNMCVYMFCEQIFYCLFSITCVCIKSSCVCISVSFSLRPDPLWSVFVWSVCVCMTAVCVLTVSSLLCCANWRWRGNG